MKRPFAPAQALLMSAFALALVGALSARSARADWTLSEISRIVALEGMSIRLDDGYVSSVWGGLQERTKADPIHAEELVITKATGFKGPVSVMLSARPASEGKRPFILLIPGMFQDSKNANALRLQEQLYASGNHVLLVANPWSGQFAGFVPKMETGLREQEGDAIAEIARVIVQYLGSDRVKNFSIAGQSYGAVIAAIVAARMPKSLRPQFDGRLLLLSPPRDIGESTKVLDALLKSTLSTYDNPCSSIPVKLAFLNLSKASPAQATIAGIRTCSKSTFVHAGFREKLIELTKEKEKATGKSWIPKDPFKRTIWERNLTMDSFLKTVSPTAYADLHAGANKPLGYWIVEARKKGPLDLKILTALDDPLNESHAWYTDNFYKYGSRELHILPFGGHSGFVSFPEFSVLSGSY